MDNKIYKEIYDLVLRGKSSSKNYNTAEQPFFMKDTNDIKNKKEYNLLSVEIRKKLSNLKIPVELKYIYKIIGSPDVEYYFNDWILQSFNSINERVKLYLKNKQSRVIDFSYMYVGMGHIIVCAIDPIDKKIFFRRDGGSNGWDRDANWAFIKSYKPIEEKKYDFSKWLEIIKDTTNYANLRFKLVN